jgi:diguanylate cyclase (GGDEF)-like protein
MTAAPIPLNETERLAALRSYAVLDTACEDSFDGIVRLAARLTGSPIALVSLVDADRQWFKARYGLGAAETPRDASFCAHSFADPSHPFVVSDARTDARFVDNPLVLGGPGIRAYAGVPLIDPAGFALGTLCIIDQKPRDFTPDVLETLRDLARMVMTALELHKAVGQLQTMALTDPLTGLANRTALLDAIDRALHTQHWHGQQFGLLYLDLNGFRGINDRHGLAVGDRVLNVAAAVLRSASTEDHVAARVGGDEFAVVLSGADMATVAAFAERVRASIAAGMAATNMPVTASVGGVAFLSAPPNAGAAVAAANTALNVAKVFGEDTVQVHEYRQPAHTEAA